MIPHDVIIAAWVVVATFSVHITVAYSILGLCWVMDKLEALFKKNGPIV